jgi:hypothetical protein
MATYAFEGRDVMLVHVHGADPRRLDAAAALKALEGQSVPSLDGYKVLVERQGGGDAPHVVTGWHVRRGQARAVCDVGTLGDVPLVLPSGEVLWRDGRWPSIDDYHTARVGLPPKEG